jgi:pimeloyl-ACP methyl ester carboxylesterase
MRRAVLGGLVADVLPARKNLTVVYTPGLSSKRRCFKSESLAKMCERRGFGFVTYDPTHSPGESTGEVRDVTLGARIRDLQAVVAQVPGDVVLAGASLGGLASAWAAAGVPWRPPLLEGQGRGEASPMEERIRGVAVFGAAFDVAAQWAALRDRDTSCEEPDFALPGQSVHDEPVRLRREAADDATLYQNQLLHSQFRRRAPAMLVAHGSKDEIVSIDAAKNWFTDSTLARKEFFEVNDAHGMNKEFFRVVERVDALCRVVCETPDLWRMFPRVNRALDM